MTAASRSLKTCLTEDMKSALRTSDKPRLATLRLMLAEIQQYEVDNRAPADDARILAILDKMAKQRRESIEYYTSAGRAALADREQAELDLITEYLPRQLTEAEIDAIITTAVAQTDGSGISAMGTVMTRIKPKVQGRADMGAISHKVKVALTGQQLA